MSCVKRRLEAQARYEKEGRSRDEAEGLTRFPCASKPCASSELMIPDLTTWINLFLLLKTDLYQGSALAIMRRAKASETDIEIMARLNGVFNATRSKIQEEESKQKAGTTSYSGNRSRNR